MIDNGVGYHWHGAVFSLSQAINMAAIMGCLAMGDCEHHVEPKTTC